MRTYPQELRADVIIIGGGVGGVAAALAALRAGKTVILAEETDWIGGQFTAQAVPPDENPWIESFGCTASYRRLRDDVRRFYRDYYPLTATARHQRELNPGGGWVSRLCHEPRVSLAVMNAHLQPYFAMNRLTILLEHKPLSAQTDGNLVQSVTVVSARDGEETVLSAPYFLDATELGDVLPLAGVEFVTGAEARAQTGEAHAPDEAQPMNQQSISVCFAVSHHAGENHVIEKPADYDFWRAYRANFWPAPNLDWKQTHPITLQTRERSLFPVEGRDHWEALWDYRRILGSDNFEGDFPSITLVNWPQIDYWLGTLVGVSEEEAARHLQNAKQLSLCFLYWMQTQAPRHDGDGIGYPEIRLRPDIVGTRDGLAKYPYIRESRRIQAEFTICEQHVAQETRPDGAQPFDDSVGIGCYRIDLHPSTGKSGDGSDGDNYIDVGSWPFQIPLGALIPKRVENLLPASKNIGTTHITNGCYRLHPVEWNIGEAAGALAAFCLDENLSPRAVRNGPLLNEFQARLKADGVELSWPQLHAV